MHINFPEVFNQNYPQPRQYMSLGHTEQEAETSLKFNKFLVCSATGPIHVS